MIQGFTETNITAYLQTEDNRINTSVASSNIRHLFKFTNDMDGSVQYAYAKTETIYDRYTYLLFEYNATPSTLDGRINLSPAGYWKYEVYEISWQENIQLDGEHAPMTENAVLPDETQCGVVSGLVEIGKLYVEEETGEEQVQYVQHSNYVVELIIDYAGFGYTSPPTISIESGSISQATATCTIFGGEINTVTLTNKGGGYTSNPKVTLTGGGFGKEAQISANIYEKNYIYY